MPHMEGIFINGEKAKFHPEDILDTDASQYTEEIGESVTAYLTEHITNPSNPPIDTSLSIAGAAADAKETGDKFSELKEDLTAVSDVVIGDNLCDPNAVTMGYYLNSGGSLTENNQYRVSDYIPVEVGETYYNIGWNQYGDAIKTKYVAELYDADKNPITGTYVNTDNVVGIPITVSASNAVYIRACAHLSVPDGDNLILQVEKSAVGTYLKRYHKTYNNAMELPQIADLLPLEGIATRETGVNLLKNTNTTVGYINTKGGTIAEAAYLTSDYIRVTAGQAYVYSVVPATNTRLVICLYDGEKNAIPTTYHNYASVDHVDFTPNVDGYVRVSATTGMFTTRAMITKGSAAPTAYLGYVERYELADNVVIPDKSNVLSGKKWCPCGDSFSAYTNAQFTSGQFLGLDKVYSRLIAERNDMNLVSTFFASGRTLAYPSDGTFHNSLTDPNANCYYQNIPVDTDYITIMLGINDSHHASSSSGTDGEDTIGVIPIGTIDDSTTATYYGAWNVVLSWLIENRPFAHIGILVTNGCDTDDYRTAQIAIATKYGVPYIDLNGDGRTPVMNRSRNPQIASAVKNIVNRKQAVDYDGNTTGSVNTHPNWQAHEYESFFIENFLRSI